MSEDASTRPILKSWQDYRLSRIGAHAGDSELQWRGEAYLCGARAAFDALRVRLESTEELGDISGVLERIAAELEIDDLAFMGPVDD